MCQTFTGEKLSGQIKESKYTVGESEYFCTDMLRKFVCSDSFIPNLGMFVQIAFQILMSNWYNLVEMTGPEEAPKQLWILLSPMYLKH